MTVLKFIKLTFFSLFFLFSLNSFSQFSKTHYIPPISTSGQGSSSPEIQYLYVSTPNENPINVIITPIGGTPLAVTVSNSEPYEYFIGDGNDTNFIALSGDSGEVYINKGFIIEGEDLIYVSARLFTSDAYYQAAGLVSKGLAALGKTFRVGTFESVGSDPAGNFLNFVSVLATEDNTIVNFSDFPNGATIINNAATNDILLNSGESYVIAIQPTSFNPDNDNAMIGVLVESDKPIAVNSGSITGSNQNTDTDANGQDAGIDQIVPLERVGTEYIFVRGIGPDQIERPLIVAHEADTEVYVNGALEFTIAQAGEHWSIPSSFYGVSYDQYGVGPEIGVSSNMYVQTSKPAFAYQFLGGIRPGVAGPFGTGTGVPNQGMFFVPPINCQTPSIVNNIAAINKLGPDFSFEGVVTIVTETGSTVLINGNDISDYAGEVQPVNGNPLFESYTVEGLTGNVSVESSSQIYVASFGAYDYATFGGYYSGFAYQPEIILDEISVDSEGCIPNLELRLNSISTFDEYQWYFNGEMIDGAVGNSFTPTEPGYYQISGAVDDCPGLLLSDDIPVSACPPDTDSDGVNDNIDIDIDNDGILNCEESLGDKNIDFSGEIEGVIGNDGESLATVTWDLASSTGFIPVWDGNTTGDFSSLSPPVYEAVDSEGIFVEFDGFNTSLLTFSTEVSLTVEQSEYESVFFGASLDNQESFNFKVPPSKSITILNPDNQILIDTNFDGIYESGITSFSNFEIRFKLNGTSLNAADANYKLFTHLTGSLEITHYNSSSEDNGASFKMIATCFPIDTDNDSIVDADDIDSDNDGILDIIENNGVLYQPLSNIDENQDGYDDIFNGTSPLDFDGDGVEDYLDLDSDNDGIFDLQESLSNGLDSNLDGIIDGTNFGTNGLSDDLENTSDSGITNYTLSNVDEDEYFNYLDLDSDGDDCSDVIEADYTDEDVDDLLGVSPVTTDLNGLVTSALDGYNTANSDYIIAAPLSITEQPIVEQTFCESSTASVSVNLNTLDSAPVDSYQWQSSTDGIDWFDITDNTIYNGANSSVLEINNIPLSFNNLNFRVVIDREGNGCGVISNPSMFFIDPLPIITIPTSLEECDNDYDGIDIFDLSQKTEELLGGQINVTVSYYENQEDADTAMNPIVDLYTNTTADSQNIIVRLEDDITFCFATTTLQLIVNPIPEVIIPPIIEVCDDDYDGISTFDLTALDTTILNGQTGISVSYYETQEGADTATNPLASPYNNTSLNTQELIVRLEDNITGCYSTTTQGLIVNPLAVIEVIDYEICDYVNPGSMIEVFDITTKDEEIIAGQDVTLSYHNSLVDAQSGDNPYTTAELVNYSNSTSASEEIFIRLVQNVTACVTTGSFNIVVNPLPNVIINTDLVQCDIDDIQDGISIYNLEEAAENIVIPNGTEDSSDNYVLTFHLSQEDLDAGINAIPNPTSYVNITPLQNIYCRVQNIATTCYTTSFFYLETIFNPIPEDAGLIVCDNSEGNGNDYDGLGLFTLSDADNYILSLIVANPNNDITDPSQLTIAYYTSESDALLEFNQLPNQYTSETPDSQILYLRVERDNDCFGINSMLLQVVPVPVYNEVADEILCTYTPGSIEIDLNDYNSTVLGEQNAEEVIITYHSSQLDADTGFNTLVSPYTVNEQETIFVRVEVEDGDPFVTACFISNINFTLTVEPRPTFIAPDPIIVCDDDGALDGLTTIDISVQTETIAAGILENVVSYHISQEDADTGDNPLEDIYTTVTENMQTVFARIEDDMTPITGCYSTTPMDLIVVGPPAATVPSNLEFCDADADGFGVFTLTDVDAEITGNLSNLLISYHETFSDAENNLFPIVGEYNNIVAYTQTIYVRVEDTTISTDCFTYLELIIVVNDVPQIETEPTPLEVCDNDTDGFALFDLSLADEEILNGLDPLAFEVTYFETFENAAEEINPIVTPLAYTNVSPFTQDIYVRVENGTTECYNTATLTLVVNELPVLIQPDPLELCDDNNTGDEIEEFTLEDSIGQVLNGQTGIDITFHETQEDADNGDAPIFSPYTNIVNAQTIYIRAENNITGCVNTITLDLRVNPLPSPVTVDPLEACDVDADGFTSFDLESVSEDIINGELDIFVTYFETLTDAENALNPLSSPYDNIVPNTQTLFVRAENNITGCFSIVELELVTLASPQLPIVIEDIIICDEDLNGFFQFDLTQNNSLILGDQIASEFNLSYHLSQEDADTGDNPIVNPETYNNLSNPQTIYVRLESIENLCVSTGQFDLIVSIPPDAVQPLPLELCDDTVADEMTVFDLTVKNDEITNGNSWTVEYYETEEDALAGTNVILDPETYTNTAVGSNAVNPQTLFVRVTDPATTCSSFVTLTLRVLPNPTPSIDPANIELCDYDTSGDELEVFDITINELYIINGELGVSVTYHETLEQAELGTDAIVDTTVYTNITLGQQTIYVRVTNDITFCYTIVTFDLIVNPLPDVSAAEDYIACEIDTDGFYDFDLDTVSASILGTQDPLNFTVTYYETIEDAENGENALISPYTNLTNPQQLFVNMTNNTTGCFIAVPSVTIEVQEAAQANSDLDRIDYVICDNLADNDGFGTFDLSSQNDELLDGQDPLNFTVTYYETEIDAETGTNALPNSYENISNPQVIYARVDNDTTADAQCYATTTLTLLVNLLPEFDLEDSYLGCVNVNGSELLDVVVMDIGLDPGLYSFEWFDPTGTLVGTSVTYTPLVGGTFTAIATNLDTGCQNSDTTLVDASSPPEVSAVVTTEFFADIHVIEASATGEGIYEFSLDDGPWQTDGLFEDVTPGFHTVIARDVNGCGVGTTEVLVIDYPHFFTPNGDGYNDTWQVEGIQSRPLSKIYIYDRFGKLLKQLNPLGPGWDGTFNGENLPATDYWFTIRLDVVFGDAESIIKEFTGHFSLKR